jgi:hypothetical protein
MKNERSIFLLIGQSNMAGRGRLDEIAPLNSPQISMFRDGRRDMAEEPLQPDNPELPGIGIGMSHPVDLLAHNPEISIGLIPCAVGGTPLSRWMPSADLYENAIAVAQTALNAGTLCGILWHQGENDSLEPDAANSYGVRFTEMITSLRSDLSADNVPVIAGELGPFLKNRNSNKLFITINKQLRQLEQSLPIYGCVSSEGLTDNGDNLHFNAASLRVFGRRYAKKYIELA